jgi:hypothetical protein
MKISIMDLMDHYQGDATIPLTPYREASAFAQSDKKRAKTGHAKQIMTAAALVLVVAMSAFALWVSPLVQRTQGSAVAEGSNSGTEETEFASVPSGTGTILNSSYANAKLYLPAGESDEFQADTAFSYAYAPSGDSSDVPKAVTYEKEHAIFSFFDSSQADYDRDGLIWLIYKNSINDLDSLIDSDSEFGENAFLLNWHILGYDSDTVYTLFCIGMGFGDPYADQLEWDTPESVQSYFDHLETGLEVLEDFVAKNGLTVPAGCVDWKSWYQENMLGKAQAQIEALTAAQARSSDAASRYAESDLDTGSPILEQTGEGWLCKIYVPDLEDYLDVWFLYQVAIDDYDRWPESSYPQWEDAPLLSKIYQIGKDDRSVYLMDSPTSVTTLYQDAARKELFYNAQLAGKEYVHQLISELNIQENPDWETQYDTQFLIDKTIDFDTAYLTIVDSIKSLDYMVPVDRRDCYRFGNDETTCLVRIDDFSSSYLALDIGTIAQWQIKRAPNSEVDAVKADDATYCCTLGSDDAYTYYLSLSTGLRWIENSTYSQQCYGAAMDEGISVISNFMERNGITPEENWLTLYHAEYLESNS